MPIHDWTRVDAGIFHAFHQQWIIAINNKLNSGLLPPRFYALPEQYAAGFGPDVLTLQGNLSDEPSESSETPDQGSSSNTALLVAAPRSAPTAETDLEFYHRKQSMVVVRHVSGDRVVAVIEIVSPGNKSTTHAVRSFVDKALDFLDKKVHLLIIDLMPPGRRDPNGLHSLLWDEVAGQEFALPTDQPLSAAAYEAAPLSVRTYVQTLSVGSAIPDMPLFLEPNGCVQVPLESTYNAAFTAMPLRWRCVLESTTA